MIKKEKELASHILLAVWSKKKKNSQFIRTLGNDSMTEEIRDEYIAIKKAANIFVSVSCFFSQNKEGAYLTITKLL